MSSSLLLGPALIGIAAGLVAWMILALFFSEQRVVARRVRKMSREEYAQAAEIQPLAAPLGMRLGVPMGRRAGSLVRGLTPDGHTRRLVKRLRLAGPGTVAADSFVMRKIGFAVGFLVLGFALARFTPGVVTKIAVIAICTLAGYFTPDAWLAGAVGPSQSSLKLGLGAGGLVLGVLVAFFAGPSLQTLVLVVAVGWLGFIAPDAWLSGAISSRQTALRRALPDMLDMLLVSVEAGLGFDAAISKVVSSTKGPLPEEFNVVLQEIGAGMPRRDALSRLADRTGVPELSSFIMAIVQADVFGVSIANVLRTQAREMRVRRRQRAEELAQSAPAKMVFPLIICILPATLIVVITPAIIKVMVGVFGVPM